MRIWGLKLMGQILAYKIQTVILHASVRALKPQLKDMKKSSYLQLVHQLHSDSRGVRVPCAVGHGAVRADTPGNMAIVPSITRKTLVICGHICSIVCVYFDTDGWAAPVSWLRRNNAAAWNLVGANLRLQFRWLCSHFDHIRMGYCFVDTM